MTKEEAMLEKRLIELSKMAYHRDIVTFSDFLNLNELHILHSIPKNLLSSPYETFGGYEYKRLPYLCALYLSASCEICGRTNSQRLFGSCTEFRN